MRCFKLVGRQQKLPNGYEGTIAHEPLHIKICDISRKPSWPSTNQVQSVLWLAFRSRFECNGETIQDTSLVTGPNNEAQEQDGNLNHWRSLRLGDPS